MATKIEIDTKQPTIAMANLAVTVAKAGEHKPYQRTYWVNHYVDENGRVIQQGTPLDQDHFNNIEEGIVDHDNHLQEVDTALLAIPGAIESAKKEATGEAEAATSHHYTLNVPASGWTENEDGSYSQTFEVPGITAATEVGTGLYALVDSEITADEWQELSSAVGSIGRIRTDEGSVTLTCYNGAPEVDIQKLVLTEVK